MKRLKFIFFASGIIPSYFIYSIFKNTNIELKNVLDLIAWISIMIGGWMNMLALLFNGFKMPVMISDQLRESVVSKIKKSLEENKETHTEFTSETRFKFLVDRYCIRSSVFSLGDIFLTIGIILVIITMILF